MRWIICSKNYQQHFEPENLTGYSTYNFSIFTDVQWLLGKNDKWLVSGNLFIRNSPVRINCTSSIKMIEGDFHVDDPGFMHNLDGIGTIIRFNDTSFCVSPDRFGIHKFFYVATQQGFIISNRLEYITRVLQPKPSKESVLNYVLAFHFTGGSTFFEGVKYCTPGKSLVFDPSKGLITKTYFDPYQLLQKERKKIEMQYITDTFVRNISNSSQSLNQDQISLSLTGGADTRNLLAAFLKLNLKPRLYTYGNSASNDCVKSEIITKSLSLDHTIHDIKITSELFASTARKIVQLCGGLASIHRVHRYLAVEQEAEKSNHMFLGTMGGEFVRGVSEDNYIISPMVYKNWYCSAIQKERLDEFLLDRFVRTSPDRLETTGSLLSKEPYLSGSAIERKFAALVFLTTHLHDAQDINLYSQLLDGVYAPFLNIDYLELLFSSQYCFTEKEKSGFLKRFDNPVFAAEFLKHTYPLLLKFNYSGEHKGSEVLISKYYAAARKSLRKRLTKRYPPNFPLGSWMQEFVAKNIEPCRDYDVLTEIFDFDALQKSFEQEKHGFDEAYWLKYTNPIMMRFILEEFS
ncbi:MAG: hypothetical protein ACK4VN_00100 [Bacteroidales bacterium]